MWKKSNSKKEINIDEKLKKNENLNKRPKWKKELTESLIAINIKVK